MDLGKNEEYTSVFTLKIDVHCTALNADYAESCNTDFIKDRLAEILSMSKVDGVNILKVHTEKTEK